MTNTEETNLSLIIYVDRRPDMFKVHNNMFHAISTGVLEKMFTNPDFKVKEGKITLYFPERYLNIVQQRDLVRRLEACGYVEAVLFTHSVYIIQTAPNNVLRIIECDLKTIDESFTMCDIETVMPDDTGLTTL